METPQARRVLTYWPICSCTFANHPTEYVHEFGRTTRAWRSRLRTASLTQAGTLTTSCSVIFRGFTTENTPSITDALISASLRTVPCVDSRKPATPEHRATVQS